MQFGENPLAAYLRQCLPSSSPAWRISFSLAEKTLVKSFTFPQKRCFLLLKVLLHFQSRKVFKELESIYGDSEDWDHTVKSQTFSVSSFLLKHVMFWTLEKVDQAEWQMNNLYKCVCYVLDQFEVFLENSFLPHYFFGFKKNLMAGDIGMKPEKFVEMKSKCERMRRQILDLRKNLIPALIQLPNHDHILDYQWSWNHRNLAKTFHSMAKEINIFVTVKEQNQFELKKAIIWHYKNMINIIKHTPRMYGRGVNWKLVKLLTKEIEIMQKPNSTLRELRQIEEAKFVNKHHQEDSVSRLAEGIPSW